MFACMREVVRMIVVIFFRSAGIPSAQREAGTALCLICSCMFECGISVRPTMWHHIY